MTVDSAIFKFILYVAGDLPNSRRAIRNLKHFCESCLKEKYELTILDVLKHPERAISDRVLLTPQLIITQGARRQRIVGDMEDRDVLRQAINMPLEVP